ncbi:Mss4-like protein [Trichoderma pleuroticola]
MSSNSGTCNCGSITVTLNAAPSVTLASFSMNYLVEEKEFTVSDPKSSAKQYLDSNTASKALVTRTFCQTCGSPLFSQPSKLPGKYFVKASLFDEIPSSRTDIFLEKKIHWEGDVDVSI